MSLPANLYLYSRLVNYDFLNVESREVQVKQGGIGFVQCSRSFNGNMRLRPLFRFLIMLIQPPSHHILPIIRGLFSIESFPDSAKCEGFEVQKGTRLLLNRWKHGCYSVEDPFSGVWDQGNPVEELVCLVDREHPVVDVGAFFEEAEFFADGLGGR